MTEDGRRSSVLRPPSDLRDYLEHADYSTITRFAATNKRVLSELIALTLDADELIGWRAVKALGLASAVVADHDPEFVRGILRRLMWMMNDESGSIGWRAPQAMGAIIARAIRDTDGLELFARRIAANARAGGVVYWTIGRSKSIGGFGNDGK